jgi:hypothetical protein
MKYLCTVQSNGSTVPAPDDTYALSTGKREIKEDKEKLATVPYYLRKIPHGLPWD